MTAHQRTGFTLIELLVSLTVIGILIALLLPAVQSVRTAAQRTQCKNNLRQIALAMQGSESACGRFPSNGWGYLWIGEPDRGTDRGQPGGWIYNLLPYLEQQPLRDVGKGDPAAVKRQALSSLMQKALPVFRCPARPGANLSPQNPALNFRNSDWAPFVAKTDYAVNEGDFITNTGGGPRSHTEGDSPNYAWDDMSRATGICFQRSETRAADISDGMSQTYLIGEKYVGTGGYDTFDDPGHDQSMYSGVDLDINRWVTVPPLHDTRGIHDRAFGSAHTQGCHMAFCDGSVRLISYGVNGEVHRRLGNRRDGLPVEVP